MGQNFLAAVARLTRIEHSIMLVIAVIAAELIAGGLPATWILVLSLATPILSNMGAFAINDYFDVETDKVNKRLDRPIVSGAINKKDAYRIAVLCLVLGALASLPINTYAFVIAVLFGALNYLYSYKLKDTLLVGNIVVALSMAVPFLYGNFVISGTLNTNIFLIMLMVFLAGMGREIHGMIRDRAGDLKARHSSNLVQVIGVKDSALWACSFYVESIAIGLFLFIFQLPFRYNLVYIIPITVVNLAFMYVAAGYLTVDTRKFFDLSRNLSLAAMALGLVAFLVSAIFYVPI